MMSSLPSSKKVMIYLLVSLGVLGIALPVLAGKLQQEPDVILRSDKTTFIQTHVFGGYSIDRISDNILGGVSTEASTKLKEYGLEVMPGTNILNPSQDITICTDAKQNSYCFDGRIEAEPLQVLAYYQQSVVPWKKSSSIDQPFISALHGGGYFKHKKGFLSVYIRKQNKHVTGRQRLEVQLTLTTPR